MKVRDVPQDEGSCLAGNRKLNYAVDDDGHYRGVATIGWETESAATNVGLHVTRAQIVGAWESARAGKSSPLAYHMAVVQMDAGQLARDAGMWAWQVRRHLRADVFPTLSAATLARYADVLGISVDELASVPVAPDLP